MAAHIRPRADGAHVYRRADEILGSRLSGSCAEDAMVLVALARVAGIPAVFVNDAIRIPAGQV